MSQPQNAEHRQPEHHTPLDWDVVRQTSNVQDIPITLNKVTVKPNGGEMAVSALTFPTVDSKIKGILTNITIPEGFNVISVSGEDGSKSINESGAKTMQQISMPFLWPHTGDLEHAIGHSGDNKKKIPRACAMVTFDSLFILRSDSNIRAFKIVSLQGSMADFENSFANSFPDIVYEQVPANYFLLAIMPNATLVYITFEKKEKVEEFINIQHNGWIDTGAIMWEESLGCFLIAYDERLQGAVPTPVVP
jgi:hypothetical protein